VILVRRAGTTAGSTVAFVVMGPRFRGDDIGL